MIGNLFKFLKKNNLIILIIFSTFFIFLVMLGISLYFYNRRYNIEISQFKSREQERLSILDDSIMESLKDLKIDLQFIYKINHLENFLESDNKQDRDLYTSELLNVGKNKKIYDQIRYIDETGNEVIRINYRGGLAYIVTQEKLQNKTDRSYFTETMHLDEEEIYLSILDLNYEDGEIEKPFKPTLRIAMPVFHEGERKGILIINYLAENIIKKLNFTLKEGNEQIYLVNQDGYWLIGPNKDSEWGFMFEDKKEENIKNWNSTLWDQIYNSNNSQSLLSEKLFTTHTIYPSSIVNANINDFYNFKKTNLNGKSWTIVSDLPKEIFLKETNILARALIATNVFVSLILIFTATITSINIKNRIKAEETIVGLNSTLKIIAKILRHDLANMFTHIDVSLDLIEDGSQGKDILKEIKKSTTQGISIINQMRQLETMVSINKKLSKIDLLSTLNTIIKNFKIEINIVGKGTILADEAIANVFSNIISNAIRHGKTEKMNIEIKKIKNKTRISFVDFGQGIPIEIKKKIFEEGFKHGETANTGLGLYIVEQTINRYGGKVWVEDNKPKGAIFIIEL